MSVVVRVNKTNWLNRVLLWSCCRWRTAVWLCAIWLCSICLNTAACASPQQTADKSVLTFSQFGEKKRFEYELDNNQIQLSDGVSATVADRLIIKTLPSLSSQRLAQQLNSKCDCVYDISQLYHSDRFHYYQATLINMSMTSSLLQSLLQLPGVTLVQPDLLQYRDKAAVEVQSFSSSTTSHDALAIAIANVATTNPSAHQGSGVRIAVIDDGFDFAHPDLTHIPLGFAYDVDLRRLGALPQFPEDTHGTQLLGPIWGRGGIAPKAELIALRQTQQWTSHTILALSLAARAKADVINCSWHSNVLMEPVADVIRDIALFGREGQGLPVVFAAGNTGRSLPLLLTEATMEEAIVIGTTGIKRPIAKFSNHGTVVDAYLPGIGVTTTRRGGGYDSVSGTSVSAAIATGMIALMIANNHHITLNELEKQLGCINSSLDNLCQR